MDKPKITVMIPTYNQAAYMDSCLNAILKSEYPNLEVVLCDDCSADGTFDIATEHESDPRLSCFRNATNLGRVANYRRLLYELSNGDWVLNCDGDDLFLDNGFFESAAKAIRSHPNLVAVTANRYKYSQDREACFPQRVGYLHNREGAYNGTRYFLDTPKMEHPLFHITTLYKRSAAMEAGFYEEEIMSADLESLLRLLPERELYHLDCYPAYWRAHESNISRSRELQQQLNNARLPDLVSNKLKPRIPERVSESWRLRMSRRMHLTLVERHRRDAEAVSAIKASYRSSASQMDIAFFQGCLHRRYLPALQKIRSAIRTKLLRRAGWEECAPR